MCTTRFPISTFIVSCLMLSAPVIVESQVIRKWEAGLNIGGYIYQGDLTPEVHGSITTIRPGIGLSITRIFSSRLSARLLFNIASLAADESIYPFPEWRRHRNFSFQASVKEGSLLLHYNMLGNNFDGRKYEPYIFAGAGISSVSVNRNYSRIDPAYFSENSEVQQGLAIDAVAPSTMVIPVVPVGGGVRYNLSDRMSINVEAAYRFMNNDYLDGFSVAANPNLKDHYTSISIGAAYKFGGKEKYGCPGMN